MAPRALSVLQLLPALHGGGVERGTVEVANALTGRGHRSLVISGGGELTDAMPGTEHRCWPIGAKTPWTLRLVPRLRALLRDEGVDVVHARSRAPAWVAYLAWRGLPPAERPRFVTTAHGYYSVSRYSAVMTRGERVIAVSESVRDYLLASYPELDPARIALIHRGVDPDEYRRGYQPPDAWREEWRRSRPELHGRRVITLAGRITRLKGHLDFVALLRRLLERGLDVHGLVVGGEDVRRRRYAREVDTEADRAGLGARLTRLPHRHDLREILAVSDLVVSLSERPESFGRTVLEALALGRPVVGYAHGGVGELLRALFPAGAVQPHDVDAAALTAARVLEAPPPEIGSDPRFTLPRMLGETLALYERLAAATGEEPR